MMDSEVEKRQVDGRTQLVGLIGYGIEGTLSPAMHNAAFHALNLNWIYVPLRVKPGLVAQALQGLLALDFRGANVTVPHKLETAKLVGELKGDAAATGAVNTLVREGEGFSGHNTDVHGFEMLIAERGIEVSGKVACLIGAGGAALAVGLVMARKGAARIYVLNRTPSRAEDLRERLKSSGTSTDIRVEELGPEGARVLKECDLVVNCTPLGAVDRDELPLRYESFREGMWAVDLKYGSTPTAFLREAAARGAVTADGRLMLLHQAAASFRLWTGIPAPLEVMREALREALTEKEEGGEREHAET